MSDHTHTNINRSDGTSGRGLLIAFAVIVAIVALIAVLGSFGGSDGTTPADAITPAEDTLIAPVPETAPAPTE
ncbi:MAG: hypothetical protein AAF727_07015 [Pseudomonadota bacterium]